MTKKTTPELTKQEKTTRDLTNKEKVVGLVFVAIMIIYGTYSFVSDYHPLHIPSDWFMVVVGISALIGLLVKKETKRAKNIYSAIFIIIMLGTDIAVDIYNNNHLEEWRQSQQTEQTR